MGGTGPTVITDTLAALREALTLDKTHRWAAEARRAEIIDRHINCTARELDRAWTRCHCWPNEQHLSRTVRASLAALGAEPEVVQAFTVLIANKIRSVHYR